MSDLTQILNIGYQALTAERTALDVTSNNISNANTVGYSKEDVNFQQTDSVKTKDGRLGTGVIVQSIQRQRDAFVDNELRNSQSAYGSDNMESQLLSQVESIINEPSDSSISTSLDNFFNAFNNLSANPEDEGLRESTVQAATTLSQQISTKYQSLKSMQASLSDDITNRVNSINTITEQIADLNKSILAESAAGGSPNDLMDKRDSEVDQLTQLADVRVSVDSTGSYNVSIGGTQVVSRSDYVELGTSTDNQTTQIITKNSKSPVTISSGELAGILTIQNSTLPSYMSKLDTLASTLISQVNTLHKAGYGLQDQATGVIPTGNNFFDGNSATTIQVDPKIMSNLSNLAASIDGTPGNNDIASAISELRDKKVLNGDSTSITQYYDSFVTQVGADSQSAASSADGQKLVTTQLQNQQDSVSGVSLDEETTNLIKFQNSYAAAAKVIMTVNSMYDTLMNMV